MRKLFLLLLISAPLTFMAQGKGVPNKSKDKLTGSSTEFIRLDIVEKGGAMMVFVFGLDEKNAETRISSHKNILQALGEVGDAGFSFAFETTMKDDKSETTSYYMERSVLKDQDPYAVEYQEY